MHPYTLPVASNTPAAQDSPLKLTDQTPHLQRWQRSEARRRSAQAWLQRTLALDSEEWQGLQE